MPTKLKIKMGHIEFEYEGDAAYDSAAVKDLFSHMESLLVSAPPRVIRVALDDKTPAESEVEPPLDIVDHDTQTVAAHLQAKTGVEVAIAAAAHLQICQGKKGFTRKELLADMQQAHGYYNQAMSGNLTKILRTLISQKRVVSTTGGQITLSAAEAALCRAKLAQS